MIPLEQVHTSRKSTEADKFRFCLKQTGQTFSAHVGGASWEFLSVCLSVCLSPSLSLFLSLSVFSITAKTGVKLPKPACRIGNWTNKLRTVVMSGQSLRRSRDRLFSVNEASYVLEEALNCSEKSIMFTSTALVWETERQLQPQHKVTTFSRLAVKGGSLVHFISLQHSVRTGIEFLTSEITGRINAKKMAEDNSSSFSFLRTVSGREN